MSLRYTHLAPDEQREGAAKLNDKPLLALITRLARSGADECRGLSVTSRFSTIRADGVARPDNTRRLIVKPGCRICHRAVTQIKRNSRVADAHPVPFTALASRFMVELVRYTAK